MYDLQAYGWATNAGLVSEINYTEHKGLLDLILRRQPKERTFINTKCGWYDNDTGKTPSYKEYSIISQVILRIGYETFE
jgi:hypothetical protein